MARKQAAPQREGLRLVAVKQELGATASAPLVPDQGLASGLTIGLAPT